jgi:crotonobetainyl-CoA:carnitine CoA-transferase CaiB-like acyl-CoA transferase
VTDRPPLAVLSGVRVLSFTQFLLGPSGVQFLADLGADVVKIEPPGGRLWERNWSGSNLFLNGVSAFFLLAHRNQRSLTLDLKKPEALEVARRLVERADVLVQNFRPGVMERLGLGSEQARAWNPRLVYVSASGYGGQSPYRDRPGQDLLMQAVSGLASISGRAGQPPTAVGTAVIDQHGAALLAMGVLAALLERARTGQGLDVDVSMVRAALDL